MSEILDFLIDLIAYISNRWRRYQNDASSATIILPDERKTILEHLNAHLSKDPATNQIAYSHILVLRKKKKLMMILLDREYKKIASIWFTDFLNSDWSKGRVDA